MLGAEVTCCLLFYYKCVFLVACVMVRSATKKNIAQILLNRKTDLT